MWFWSYIAGQAIVESNDFWFRGFKQQLAKKLLILGVSLVAFPIFFGTIGADLLAHEFRQFVSVGSALVLAYVLTIVWKFVILPPRLFKGQEFNEDVEIFPVLASIIEPEQDKVGRFDCSVSFRNKSEERRALITDVALKMYFADGHTVTELGDISGVRIELSAPDYRHINFEFRLHEPLKHATDAELIFTDVAHRRRTVPVKGFLIGRPS